MFFVVIRMLESSVHGFYQMRGGRKVQTNRPSPDELPGLQL